MIGRSEHVTAIALALGAIVLLGTGAYGAEEAADSEIRRVVVIHLDTTRTDDFSCYGGIPKTPNIDAAAAKGMRFDNFIAPLPKTSPSIASFMTGRLANSTGVYNVGCQLPHELVTLAEMLRDQGFATGGFVSNLAVAPLKKSNTEDLGYAQGFDEYRGICDRPTGPKGLAGNDVARRLCEPLTEAAIEFVDRHREDKFFLWVFHLDPHAPYAPPPPYDTMYLEHPALVAKSVDLTAPVIHPQAFVPERWASHEYIARHMGEVSMTDEWVGKLLARLEGLPGKTLIVITADHGESLGDVNYWFGHGSNTRYPCVDVPFIVQCDGAVPAGVSHALAANIDIAPTILDILGCSAEPLRADGRSLVPAFVAASPWPERLIPLQAYRGENWRGTRSERYSFHFVVVQDVVGMNLYDRQTDPHEQRNIAWQKPQIAKTHYQFMKDRFSPKRTAAKESSLADDPEMRERLENLGYLE